MVSSKLLFIALASVLTSAAAAAPAEKRGGSSNGYSKSLPYALMQIHTLIKHRRRFGRQLQILLPELWWLVI